MEDLIKEIQEMKNSLEEKILGTIEASYEASSAILNIALGPKEENL